MRILFDHGTPRPLRDYLTGHSVDTAAQKGWSDLSNGQLLDQAERDAYDLLITADQNMRHQQNLRGRRLAVVVLLSNRWPRIRLRTEEIQTAIEGIQPGEWREVPL